jgi:hypothetical protein
MDRRRLSILGLGIALVIVLLALAVPALASRLNQAPPQPIAFDHVTHVKELGIDCTFCHRNAARGKEAGIPAVEQCMFCHQVVGAGNPEIEKLRAAWINEQPINWLRVHRLPDHVHFLHEPHIRSGLSCSTCHGEVGSMRQVRQARNLRMGDCLACHRQRSAPTDCGACHY